MPEIIADVEIPDTAAAAAATRLIAERTTPLIYHHSRRVFLFASLHACRLGLRPDPELLYVAALFHDAGLLAPASHAEQRFELDGADLAREFLLERGFPAAATDAVWNAIALHTTPGIPERMGLEAAATALGVVTDAIGAGLEKLDTERVAQIVLAHPRGDFKREFLETFRRGLERRPTTTYGTMNADILEHFDPDFRRTSMVERIVGAPWPT